MGDPAEERKREGREGGGGGRRGGYDTSRSEIW